MEREPVWRPKGHLTPLYAAIEGGGTKFVCAVGTGPDDVLRQLSIATTTPAETLGAVADFIGTASMELGGLSGLGIGTFGPIMLDPGDARYGQLLATPKPGWEGADVLGPLAAATHCPTALDTDVNAAALAEARLGAGIGADPVAYVTVGTGIGVGLSVHGKPVHGLLHPEVGHLLLRRHPDDLGFAGVCPFHGDCSEGLASGPAILARSGTPAEEVPPDHPHWAIVAHTLGELCATLLLTLAPQRIVLGGGVMSGGRLLPQVRAAASEALAGYLASVGAASDLDTVIVAPKLAVPGLAGAFLLAREAAC